MVDRAPRLLASVRIGKDIADLSDLAIQTLLADETSDLSENARQWLPLTQQIIFGSGFYSRFTKQPRRIRQRGDIVGSTHFVVESARLLFGGGENPLNATDPQERTARYVELYLLWDGSPYVHEADVAFDCANRYAVIVAPDMPPVLINCDYWDTYKEVWGGNDTEEIRLATEHFSPEVVHRPDEAACETILRGLRYSFQHDMSVPAINANYFHA